MEISTLIQRVRQASSPAELLQAVQALAASQDAQALPVLIEVLGYNNPAVAGLALQSLIAWGEPAVLPLLANLDGYNYGARAYSVRALAALGDARALAVLVAAAETDFAPSVRRAALKGLGRLYAAGPESIGACLRQVVQDEDWSIRYAAVVSLEALARQPEAQAEATQLLTQLADHDPEPVLQARALLALQRAQQPSATCA